MSVKPNLTRSDVARQAKRLKDANLMVALRDILSHWLQIVIALGLFYWYPTWWAYVPLIIFISARQYALAILLHDGQHTLLHRNKTVNRMVGTWLISAPLGAPFKSSQRSHLDHHLHLNLADKDPDYALYCFGEPAPKQSPAQILFSFIIRTVGGKVLSVLKKSNSQSASRSGLAGLYSSGYDFVVEFWPIILAQGILFIVFTLIFGWYGYFALWLFPLATLASFYNDFRIFCEHSLIGRDAVSKDERMISFISNPVERFFIAPNHMNYHAEHHWFPFVPHNKLPELRRAVRACPELNEQIEWRPSYFGHLIAYIGGTQTSARGATTSSAQKEAGPVAY